MSSSLGQRIAYYRKRNGLSQKELAEAIGMSPTALSYYETDKREPNILVLMNLARTLNITGDTLLGLEPHPDTVAQNGDECALLRSFRALNGLGRDRVLEYIAGLEELPKYAGPAGNGLTG